jgi:hypothetical protein
MTVKELNLHSNEEVIEYLKGFLEYHTTDLNLDIQEINVIPIQGKDKEIMQLNLGINLTNKKFKRLNTQMEND